MEYRWLNCYRCPECGGKWADAWECQVDDDCPHCGYRHISPYKATELDFEES